MKSGAEDVLVAMEQLRKEMTDMRQTIHSLHAQVASLTRRNQQSTKEKNVLKSRIKELEQRLSKYEQPGKNSSNSSTPPSKEDMKSEIKRRTKSLRKKSDRPIGGQLGHEGYTRDKIENPDEIIDHVSAYCINCGRDLLDVEAVLDYTTQEISLPVIKPIIKEHRHFAKVCTCGHHNRASSPRKRGGNDVTFSKEIQALVVYCNVVQCVPYQRLQSMLETVFNIRMSQGTISNLIRDAKKKAEPAIALIKEYIANSPIVGFDESGCYCNDRLDWSWIAQTIYSTLVFRANSRSGKVLEDMFGDALENMIAVTDRHSAYFSLNFLNHQICLAHILREVQYLNELDDKQQWSKQLQTLLQEAIHERNQNLDKKIDTSPWLTRLDNILTQNVEHLEQGFRRLKNGLIKHRDHIFKFLENPAIPPDNNGSERGIRKLKVKQKISGTFRSDKGADAFMVLHSITDTAWKNNQSPLEAINAILSAQDELYPLAE